jgi:hypothetical protein
VVDLFFQIENNLTKFDYLEIVHALEDKLVEFFELLPGFEYECVQVSPLVISAHRGYSITVSLGFSDPIGKTVCSVIGIKEFGLKKSVRSIEMDIQKSTIETDELTEYIKYSLLLVENLVNYACMTRNKRITDVYTVDSNLISQQLKGGQAERERTMRGEEIKAFELVHADTGWEIQASSKGLIPFYEEYDKWDLFGGKKVYRLLPRDFVSKLLKCQGPTMIAGDQFSPREKKVLDDLVKRHQIKRRKIAGKPYYFDLDDKTKTYLIKTLKSARL